MSSRILAFACAAALSAACGSPSGAGAPAEDGPGACSPLCDGRACGGDGCGGTCGTCAGGASCSASGACVAVPASLSCPAGQRCTVLERSAYTYSCAGPAQCERTGLLATYGTYEGCKSLGCSGGNSTCGEQFGRSDPEVWACLACVASCGSGETTLCPLETAGGCAYGDELIPCICQ